MTIAEKWQSFAAEVLPADLDPTVKEDMRRCFYAGAQGVFALMFEIGVDSKLSQADRHKAALGIGSELQQFVSEMELAGQGSSSTC